jgi:hypothetical protein
LVRRRSGRDRTSPGDGFAPAAVDSRCRDLDECVLQVPGAFRAATKPVVLRSLATVAMPGFSCRDQARGA